MTFRHLPSGFNETAQVTAIAAQKRIHRHPGHSLDRKTKQRVYRKPTPITRLVSSIVSLPGAWAASTNMNWCGCARAWPAGNVQRVLFLVAVQRSNRFSTISSSCSIWRSRRVAIWFHRPFLRGLGSQLTIHVRALTKNLRRGCPSQAPRRSCAKGLLVKSEFELGTRQLIKT